MTQAEVTELLFAIQSFYPNWNNKLDKDTWFRPIIFNLGIEGMLFTLENG